MHEVNAERTLRERDQTDAEHRMEERCRQAKKNEQMISEATEEEESCKATILNYARQFQTFFGKPAPQESEQRTEFLQELEQAVRAWEDAKRDEILLKERLTNVSDTSVEALEEQWHTWEKAHQHCSEPESEEKLLTGEMPLQEENLDDRIDALHQEIAHLQGKIRERKAEINTKFKETPNVSQLELEKKRCLKEREHLSIQADALALAIEAMEESYRRTRSGFSTSLNARTGEILHALTGGRYDRVWVDSNYGITVESEEQIGHTWEMLSSGTMEQAYFALRIAMTELIQSEETLPLFLDDAFVLFDDRRMAQAMNFLRAYAEEQNRQIFFFTCHGRMKALAEKEGIQCKEMA